MSNGQRCRIVRLQHHNLYITAAAFPPATNISYALTRIEQSVTLTFSWTISVLGCHDVIFNIQASNCGSCPTATRYTNVTCTDIPTDGSMCTFAVQTVVCGNTTGNTRITLPLLDDRGSSNTPGVSNFKHVHCTHACECYKCLHIIFFILH